MSKWFGKNCKWQRNKYPGSTSIGKYTDQLPEFSYCSHGHNIESTVGNCRFPICPLSDKDEIKMC